MGEKVSAVYFVILFIFFQILEVKPKASDIPDKHSTAELHTPSDLFVFYFGKALAELSYCPHPCFLPPK